MNKKAQSLLIVGAALAAYYVPRLFSSESMRGSPEERAEGANGSFRPNEIGSGDRLTLRPAVIPTPNVPRLTPTQRDAARVVATPKPTYKPTGKEQGGLFAKFWPQAGETLLSFAKWQASEKNPYREYRDDYVTLDGKPKAVAEKARYQTYVNRWLQGR